MEFRHEWKHRLSLADALELRQRLSAVMYSDPHADANGGYHIRSLYFDDLRDTALREKLDGVSRREKFRIRYYNGDPSRMQLEKKSKVGELCNKQSVPITAREAQALLEGDWIWMKKDPSRPLVGELYRKMRGQGLRPKTIVDYDRIPFVFGPGNVRVTLDRNIRTGLHCVDFLNPACVTVPAGEPVILLEVKWDAYLPEIIRDAVQTPNRRASAFSKYAACRIYG